MEVKQEQSILRDNKVYAAVEKSRSWIVASLGALVAILGIIAMFVISSIDGTKENVASGKVSSQLLIQWRAENEEPFPEVKYDIIVYNNREYYFVIDSYDTNGEIQDWHFAFDGGMGYVFSDIKYYTLVSMGIAISLSVAMVNYRSTKKTARQSKEFVKTLGYYSQQKEKTSGYTQYLPDFCDYKNKQTRENAKRDIVESADISYKFYCSDDFDINKLEKWQIKKLESITKIKIRPLKPKDLLQEGDSVGNISLLPMGEEEHEKRFIKSAAIQKTIMSFASGVMIAFSVAWGNLTTGFSFMFMILASWIGAIVIAQDYVSTTLRNRYIAKADLLIEFDNMKQKFFDEDMKAKKEAEEIAKQKEEEQKVQEVIEEKKENVELVLEKGVA